jgi:hypothetical protein
MVWYGISRPTLSVSAKVACYIHYTVHESLIFGNSVGSLSRISVSSDSEHRCSPTMSPPFLNKTILTIWCAVHPLARTDWNTRIFHNVPDKVRIVSFLLYSWYGQLTEFFFKFSNFDAPNRCLKMTLDCSLPCCAPFNPQSWYLIEMPGSLPLSSGSVVACKICRWRSICTSYISYSSLFSASSWDLRWPVPIGQIL